MYSFHLPSASWSVVEQNDYPQPRLGATANMHNDTLITFGVLICI